MKVFGHRGASAILPENTIAALARAFDDGADGVELDVRPCRTGEIVVHHDARAAGLLVPISHATLAQIRSVSPAVPTLDEVWDALFGRGILHVEVKRDRFAAESVRRWVRRRGLARSPEGLHLSSFDPRILAWLTVGLPHVPRALIFHAKQRWLVPPALVARALGCIGLHPEWRLVDGALVETARVARQEVNVWTVDDPGELRRLLDLGADGVIANDPGRALRVLAHSAS